ncbi:MAG: hypothetical protein V7744_08445 [Pseudomonadales bacterium]
MKSLLNTFTLVAAMLAAGSVFASSPAEVEKVATPGKSQVVIFRPSQRSAQSYMNYRVYIDGDHAGKIRTNRHLVTDIGPGVHQLITSDRDNSGLEFTVAANETVVIRAVVDKQLLMEMEQVSADLAIAEVPELESVLGASATELISMK